ncbi:MAG: bifunctional precorrin-2 dehydrogenase/sirohydrochlorin ferrochelatase [Acidobacteriota bacterium]|nr:bifunctional precorrin-2 dehydrogenase/sirohydrochlorin ferrochelatase [Acidobacteriota bacterium]
MSRGFPISLRVDGHKCLVVGGGRVAERKIKALLRAGAMVRVVARDPSPMVQQLAGQGTLELHVRDYAHPDLDGVFLVIVATDDAVLNATVSEECRRRGLLVNVVDQPALCNFYVSAQIERGPVSISVSTGGTAPALAKHLRMLLESVVGDEHGSLAELMGELRPEVLARYDQQPDRAAAWQRLLQSDILDWLREGVSCSARAHARELMGLNS